MPQSSADAVPGGTGAGFSTGPSGTELVVDCGTFGRVRSGLEGATDGLDDSGSDDVDVDVELGERGERGERGVSFDVELDEGRDGPADVLLEEVVPVVLGVPGSGVEDEGRSADGWSADDGDPGVAVGAGAAGARCFVDVFARVAACCELDARGKSLGLLPVEVAWGAGASVEESDEEEEEGVPTGPSGFLSAPPLAAFSGLPSTLPATDPS